MKRVIGALIVVHRYLGVGFCLIFLIWFASGIVMVYKRMPEFSAEERLARLPSLRAADIRLTPGQALAAAGIQDTPRRVLLTSFRSRPVYRFMFDAGSLTVFADEGSDVEPVGPQDAAAVAADAFSESRGTVRYLDSVTQPDQWTFGNPFRTTGALHRIALGDPAGTEAYVAEATGEIVMKTDRASRVWGYLGPVLHWFYFTPLRQRASLWSNLIIYGSVVGCVVCVLGLAIGVYRFSARRRYMRGTSFTPYAGWLRWHHYAGLLFGVITFTWTLSGLLTMTPWNLFPGGAPSPAQIRAIGGDGLALERFTVPPRAALAEFQRRFQPSEIELLQFMGAPFYAAYDPSDASLRSPGDGTRYSARGPRLPRMLLTADGQAPRMRDGFTRDELLAAARAAMPGIEPAELAWLTEFDAYYYNRTRGRGLPALRVKFNDADRTWLYLDSTDGTLVLAEVDGSRLQRWLYQGLHSLDFPRLYQTPWVWYPLVIGLSLGGVAVSVTATIISWRFLRAKLRPSREPAQLSRSA